ncbi:Enoyl-CoA hydratase [Labilithrix luteola]|uniref:Enoyl-CoA hydratase n=1 Tax=Labilithrix luteola TaxID=1391654 RepID=A0A0K1PX99_9BACT|nr:crotonase/enoyl-CoA hydratase family protein [Labilithrix luteola]AKU98148.1 Enoyl-CoA hydratase [Labilithrix luteola]
MASYESMTVEIADGVAEVCLTGPGKGNAMGSAFFRELPVVFDALDRDPLVRAVVLRGSGGQFSYGLDLKNMMGELMGHVAPGNLAAERLRLLDFIGELQRGPDAVERCRKPVIAAIAGACIGGGVDVIAACDLRIASRDARFSVREVKVAIVADLGSLQRLPRIIGHGHTRELAFTGKDIDAERALRIGLVNDVYDTEADLLAAARAMAREIAANPPHVVQGVKQVLAYSEDKSIAEGNRYVALWNSAFLASQDLGEAMQAFAEKRPPRFTGK